jgi:hypothetical protein
MVLAELYDVLKTTKSDKDPNAPYFAALARLTAEFGGGRSDGTSAMRAALVAAVRLEKALLPIVADRIAAFDGTRAYPPAWFSGKLVSPTR